MRPKIITRETDKSTTYEASYGPYYLGVYSSQAQASAAIRGGEAVHLAQRKQIIEKKDGREVAKIYAENDSTHPGIRQKSGRWYVKSPVYMGGYPTLAQALEAQAGIRATRLADKKARRNLIR